MMNAIMKDVFVPTSTQTRINSSNEYPQNTSPPLTL
uniref:Uncharacterized protein n=1 Tax=Anguilla anguilla TaxID=7936 RepID=A0A0E9PTQ4_ANGAN